MPSVDRFLRCGREEFRQQKNYRSQNSLRRLIEVGVLSPVGTIPLRIDYGFRQEFGVLLCLGSGTQILWILPCLIHPVVNDGEQIVPV